MLDKIILGMLDGRQPLTGYDLKKHISESVGVFYRASFGSLYPALNTLCAKGLAKMKPEQEGGREKKYYRITAAGRAAFEEWLTTATGVAEGNTAHLAKVYFFDRLPPPVRDAQLLAYEESNRKYLTALEKLQRQLDTPQNRQDHYFKLATLYYGIRITRETIAWCADSRAMRPYP